MFSRRSLFCRRTLAASVEARLKGERGRVGSERHVPRGTTGKADDSGSTLWEKKNNDGYFQFVDTPDSKQFEAARAMNEIYRED